MKNNKTLFIAGIITLTQMFLTSVSFSQPVVKIWGSKNAQEIKKQAELYLDQLDVQENIHLTISISQELPETLHGITIAAPSQKPDIDQILTVLIDTKLSKEKQMLVLAHEMIHVKQYAKKELIVDEKEVIWKGKKFYYARAFNLQTPWEKEAYQIDHTLARLVQITQNKNKETLVKEISNYTINTSQHGNEECVRIKS